MAKKNKKPAVKQVSILEKIFNGKYKHVIFIGLLFIILSVFFFKIAFQNYAPPASDSIQWRSSAQVLLDYNKEHKDQAMWNPNVFSGMPAYLISFGAKYPFFGNLFKLTNKVMNWRILMLFLMALGVYLFMVYLKFDPIIAFISAIALPLSCHFLGLLEIGHNTKFKAIVYIPWIMFAVHYLKERRSLLALGGTAILLIVQLRANHPQISYYTCLMLLIYWIAQTIWAIKDRDLRSHLIFSALLFAAFLIAFMAIAQPYFSTYEYGHFTIRGGETGLSKSYATSWSFHPLEMFTFINPSLYGGVSPFYWGWMPFTQTSMYMGIIILLFAVIAIFYNKNRLVKVLLSVSIVTLLLSFGRHLPFLSNFLLKFMPGFNKFRVPAMILVIVQFSTVILAGFGIKTILAKIKEDNKKFFDHFQRALIVVVVLFIAFLAFSSTFENFGLRHAADASKYNAGQLKQLKTMRLDKLVNDGIQTGLFLIAAMGLTLLAGRKKLGKYAFLILIAILVITDLLLVDSRFLQNIVPEQRIENEYKRTEADKFLLNDEENFRIYPLAREFGQNSWAYYHQTIGGYHGAKLKRYQEIIENCLNAEFLDRIPINWNIVNMLNAKYVIFNQKLPIDNLEYAYYDRKQKQTIYLNNTYLPRAWFVKNTELIKEKKAIWKKLNDPEFSPAETAIVEKSVPTTFAPLNSLVTPAGFDLHELKFNVVTDTTSFLTISEIYYPAGWKAYIDGEETEIYATNYILRGVIVPKGEHTVEMRFEPKIYSISLTLSLIGLILAIVIFLVGIYIYIRSNYQGKIVYVIKE
ncbi:MAG: YfhO family protein [Candidatus Cloacimonetes bacterium]|nr:YfhO family protein [Candidatus Cloacimonadota bacterium]